MPDEVIQALSYLVVAFVSWFLPAPRSKSKRTRKDD